MYDIYWLILFIILLVIEIATLGLTTIWFAAGALVAFVAAVLGLGVGIQIILFFLSSLILLIFTRPIAVKYLNKTRTKTNAESLLGKTAVVTESIDNLRNMGTAVVNGQEWTARALSDDIRIEKDMEVTIIEIKGVKLMVEEKKEEQ